MLALRIVSAFATLASNDGSGMKSFLRTEATMRSRAPDRLIFTVHSNSHARRSLVDREPFLQALLCGVLGVIKAFGLMTFDTRHTPTCFPRF